MNNPHLVSKLVGSLILILGRSATAEFPIAPQYTLSTFVANVTPPLGHTLEASFNIKPALRIVDPLLAHGFVLKGSGDPIVLVSVDWCGIADTAHDRWREVLSRAAGTKPARVLVCSIHQHDAPIADLESARLFAEHAPGQHTLQPDFHEDAVQRVAAAIKQSLTHMRAISHIGLGQAKVDRIASTRRLLGKDGKVEMVRYSSSTDPKAKEAPEGLIDPMLKTISFWDGDIPIASLSVYATHPMSYYGQGGVSADFVGIARSRRQSDDQGVMHFYATGCGGNLAPGKYNDGSPQSRTELADRLYSAWKTSWDFTKKQPLNRVRFKSVLVRLEPKDMEGYRVADLEKQIANEKLGLSGQARAALILSWRKRVDAGRKIDIPAIDFGSAQLLLLPGEPFVEYQLFAQSQRRDSFVITLGYGDYGPGYLPTDIAYEQGGYEPGDYSFVTKGIERTLKSAIAKVLVK